jgi:hypothetical protein
MAGAAFWTLDWSVGGRDSRGTESCELCLFSFSIPEFCLVGASAFLVLGFSFLRSGRILGGLLSSPAFAILDFGFWISDCGASCVESTTEG